jgi:hypothetical protein
MSSNAAPRLEPVVQGRRWTGADVLVFSALAALVALEFWEVVAQGRVFFFRDFAFFFYPKRFIAAEAIRHWQIPFWNSYGACGEPVLGAYQSAVFYPPALIYYLLPMPQSLMWFVVLHFFLSGVGAYYVMRLWGARRPAATFAAFAWAFSPAFVGALDYISFLTALSWLPWCLAFARRITTGALRSGFLWLSISFAMAVLAAAPEPIVFIAALLAAYAVWEFVRSVRKAGLRRALPPPVLIAAAMAVGVAAAGVEVVPFLHTLYYSARQRPIMMEDAATWSAGTRDWIYLFLPRFYVFADRGGICWTSQHWLKTVYLGVIVPFLALWTLLAVRRRRNLFFAAVTIPFVAMALGTNTPVWRFLYEHFPGVGLIRFPVKFYLPAAFAVAVLAGFAVDDFLVFARRRRNFRPALLIALVLLAGLAFGACWWAMGHYTRNVYEKITSKELLSLGEPGAEQAAECYENTQWSFGRSASHLALGALALLLAGALTRWRIPRPYGTVALALAVFLDLGIFGAHLNPVAGPEIYTENPSHLTVVPHGTTDTRLYMTRDHLFSLSKLRLDRIQDLVGLRNYISLVKDIDFQSDQDLLKWLDRTSAPVFSNVADLDNWLKTTNSSQFTADVEFEVAKETFYPNLNLLYQVPAVDGFEPMGPRWHHDLIQRLQFHQHSPGRDKFLAKMWGASVILDTDNNPPGYIYEPAANPGSRAVLAANFVSADDDSQAESIVADTTIDVTKRVVLFKDDARAAAEFLGPSAAGTPPDNAEPPGAARIVYDDGNRAAFETNARVPAILFVADNFFPNFAATVDGKPAPLWRANYSYRAVPVPAGRHRVEFVWRPYDLYAGLALTVFAVAALAAVSLIRRKPR